MISIKPETILYWGMIAISLFNTIVLFWLAFTVLLNSERRTGGIWLAVAGLLVGGIFFATHTAMLDFQVDALAAGIRSWWYFFFAPIILLPHAWYLLMLWYAGFWDDYASPLHHRHRKGLFITTLLAITLIALLFFINPFAVTARSFNSIRHTGERLFPYAASLFPLYILACTALALDALHRPAKSGRMMGDIARRRARPWLLAATFVQLIVSILIGMSLGGIILSMQFHSIDSILMNGSGWIDTFDFILTALLSLMIILAGKAMVSYEIFTGKTLPRRGFLRQWRGVVTLSLAFSAVVAVCIGLELRPIFSLLLVVILMSGSFALLSWRFFKERELANEQLRPFLASQHFYDRVLASQQDEKKGEGRGDAEEMFRILCESVLETRGAKLIPLGAIAPLAGAPMYYPDEFQAPEIFGELPDSKGLLCTTVETRQGLAWMVPLRDARREQNLNGVLLLAQKCNGGLYTEEEIEVARAGGERLLDALAGAALASRLMELQRRRLGEIQVADHQTRRLLHDEVLPRLHTAMLMMSGDESARGEAQNLMADVHKEISNLLRAMPSALIPPVAQLGLIGALQKTVKEEFARDFDKISWEIEPQAQEYSDQLAPLVGEVLFHAAREVIRNAAKYARRKDDAKNAAPLHLQISVNARENFSLEIADNGAGLEQSESNRGSGQGLALHGTMMAVVGGALAVENNFPTGTRAILSLPRGDFRTALD